jgi:hypothetical protein
VTVINERILFDDDGSEYFLGKNKAFPIFMEFFHEKFSNSKISLKNLKVKNPIVCFKNENNIYKIFEESGDGISLESLIEDNEFIEELKKYDNKLGALMKVEYFVDKDFKKLYQKYKEIIKDNKSNEIKEKNEILKNKTDKKNIIKKKKKEELVTLEDYENYYLVDGNFVYPDSLPWHEYPINEKPPPKPLGEIMFLKKYEKAIEIGRKLHFCEEI